MWKDPAVSVGGQGKDTDMTWNYCRKGLGLGLGLGLGTGDRESGRIQQSIGKRTP